MSKLPLLSILAIINSISFVSSSFAQVGCCSRHGGSSGNCSPNDKVICRDGSISPSCSCTSSKTNPLPSSPKVASAPASKSQSAATNSNGSYSCDGKSVCAEMSSCEEAEFYLNSCGLTRLDRDKDGIPCESICGG